MIETFHPSRRKSAVPHSAPPPRRGSSSTTTNTRLFWIILCAALLYVLQILSVDLQPYLNYAAMNTDAAAATATRGMPAAPASGAPRPVVLRPMPVPHGVFLFNSHSQEYPYNILPTPELYHPNFTHAQKVALDIQLDQDEQEQGNDGNKNNKNQTTKIQKNATTIEAARCQSYGFRNYRNPIRRRRLFFGAMLADDSWEVITVVGTEMWNLFHTVAFVESNSTISLKAARPWRFYPNQDEQEDAKNTTQPPPLTPHQRQRNLRRLYQLFGNQTKVSVDYYVTNRQPGGDEIFHEMLQREAILQRWKHNGMTPDDVGILSDTDETFTRDFLRALQTCDVPEFRPERNCKAPKVVGRTLILEATPDCVVTAAERVWYHPDAIIGKCIEGIGNTTLHPQVRRDQKFVITTNTSSVGEVVNITTYHGNRIKGYGEDGRFELYHSEHYPNTTAHQTKNEYGYKNATGRKYPLWSGQDFRGAHGGKQYTYTAKEEDGEVHYPESPTAYHFHNFFTSSEEIRFKYRTYGHPHHRTDERPIWEFHRDLKLAYNCAKGNYNGTEEEDGPEIRLADPFEAAPSKFKPIYYLNPEIRQRRHTAWQHIIEEEEARSFPTVSPTPAPSDEVLKKHEKKKNKDDNQKGPKTEKKR